MSTPTVDIELDFQMPYTVPLSVAYEDTVVQVQSASQNPAASDPTHRIVLPAGESRLSLTVSRMRGIPTLWVVPKDGTAEFQLTTFSTTSPFFYSVGLKDEAELELRLSFTPNSNDRATAQAALTVMPQPLYSPPAT